MSVLPETLATLSATHDPLVAARLILELDRMVSRDRTAVSPHEIAAAVLVYIREATTHREPNAPEVQAALRALRLLVTLAPALPDEAVALLRERSAEPSEAGLLSIEALSKLPAETPCAAEFARALLLSLDLEGESGFPGLSSDASVCSVLGVLGRCGPAARDAVEVIVERCLCSDRVERLGLTHVHIAALDALLGIGAQHPAVEAGVRLVMELPRTRSAVRARSWRILAKIEPPPADLVGELRRRLPQAEADEAFALVELLTPHMTDGEVLAALVASTRRRVVAPSAIYALARSGRLAESLAAVGVLRGGTDADRLAAVDALDRSARVLPEAVSQLIDLTRDRNKDVRLEAARALLRQPLRSGAVLAALDGLARDRAAAVRELVARAHLQSW